MDSKRKTWNLKHQVTQVEDLKQKKKDWEYHSYQKSSIQARMQAIFREHEIETGNDGNDEEDNNEVVSSKSFDQKKDDQMFNVPVTLAIEQSII